MKKIYSFLVLILCVCAFALIGCGQTEISMPSTNAVVTGNGGIAVIKEDYLYYVNGYVEEGKFSDYKVDNVYGEVEQSAIYRTKLNNGQLNKDADGFLTETERVVPKTVGFSNSGFYIIGDYLYYVTPNMNKDSKGVLQSDKIDFCRIKLNGTENKVLFTTENKATELQWSVYNYNCTIYVVALDGTKLISYNCNENEKVVMADDVTGVVLLKQETYAHDKSALKGFEKYIYYTRDIVAGENNAIYDTYNGNVVCKVEIGKDENTDITFGYDTTYAIKDFKNGAVYFTETLSNTGNSSTTPVKMYSVSVKNDDNSAKAFNIQNKVQITALTYTNLFVVDVANGDTSSRNVIAVEGNKIYRVFNGQSDLINNKKIIYSSSKVITSIGVFADFFYFWQENQMYRVSVFGENETPVRITDSSKTYNTGKAYVDFDGRNVFVMASYKADATNGDGEEHYYLNMIDTLVTNNEYASKFVGKFETDHLPTDPNVKNAEDEAEEDVEEKHIPWII